MLYPKCEDRVTAWHRIMLWVLVTLGIEAVLYYGAWWLEPAHRRNMFFFTFLTFAIFWGLFRSLINWFYLLFIRIPPETDAPEGVKVDVFMTAMPGEPRDMIAKSLTAASGMNYPHQTYLLDGGNDAELIALCRRLGVRHLDCTNVHGAKAGKINHALEKSSGDYILVIDPDHIARPDFLDKVLGHFSDPEVGFVQVVQAYHNQNESFVARAGAEQTYGFYGPTMMGMHGLGAAVAIGANCTFRRTALEDIGGHAVDLAEDLLTSLRMHANGWKSAYVPYRASFGQTPADLHSHFKQQLKWSTGMFNVFFRDYLPNAFRMRLGAALHYFFAGTYYLEGVATAITCILPVLFLFFGLWAVEMELDAFLLHLAPYVFMSMVIGWYTQRWLRDRSEQGFPWRGMFLLKATWPVFVLGFVYWITRTRVPYLPTPKTAEKGVFTNLVLPHIAVIVLSLSGIIYALVNYDRFVTGTWLMMFFAACNIVLMLPTVLVAHAGLLQPRTRRSS
ncbi:MAG: glycosyltransferase [Chitinivibrionales bacterium]|nr:glycosyltransferase [Chitinivibrionales bacterium]MBD3396817.1 glycosyltransferase [Chitinivibrionales bacterium]